MKAWSFLCRKHFELEKKRKPRKILFWCVVDKQDKKSNCDFKGCCKNKAYREVYY